MIPKPLPFQEAIKFILDKEQLPADWDAATWQEQEPDFRNKAFFSAKVEDARFLDRAQGFIFDYMAKVRETITTPDGETVTALKIGGRADFIKRMRDFMVAEGMADEEDFPSVNQRDVRDLRSHARLSLIFETNVKQAYGYGQWKQGNTPAVRDAFPAARLVREVGVTTPRPRHEKNLGEIRLKDDPWWEDFINDEDIGGFGVPWGPYGFNSGVNQEDVSRSEAEREGIKVPAYVPTEPDRTIVDGTKASTKTMDPDLKKRLLDELRAGPTEQDVDRQAALAGRGQGAYAPDRGLKVVEDGDSIRLL